MSSGPCGSGLQKKYTLKHESKSLDMYSAVGTLRRVTLRRVTGTYSLRTYPHTTAHAVVRRTINWRKQEHVNRTASTKMVLYILQ